jgi:glycosyltransferase involved in cell wall biosynthesis
MRIVLLSVSAEMGGSEASLLQLVRGVRRLAPRFEPIVIVPREGSLADRVREAEAEVRVLPMPPALARFGEWSVRGASAFARRGATFVRAAGAAGTYGCSLSRLLSRLAPDVVHTNGFKLHLLGSRAAPDGVPVVWHLHEYLGSRRLSRTLLRHHVHRATTVVANSHSVAEDARRALGPGADITAIYNAVDLTEFSPQGPVADLDALAGLPPVDSDVRRIGLIATFARWKGHETFLHAVKQLEPGRWRAYIVGGPLYDTAGSQHSLEDLRGLAASLGVSDRVGFTGFVDRPSSAMRALDVVVHASTEPEPFGLVIAEGLACGRVVVVSAAGGAAELVEDGVDALTFAPGDAAALAGAMRRAISDAPRAARLGAEARQTATRRFDPDVFAHAFLDVYERAISRVRLTA